MTALVCPIRHHSLNHPSSPALISGPLSVTYRRLDDLITTYERKLREKGAKKDDRFALLPEPDLKTIVRLWAVWRAGGVVCFLNPRLPLKERHALARFLKCRWSFSPDVPGTRRISPRLSTARDFEPAGEILLDPASPATMMPTSGSTAAPKIVVHSLANHFSSMEAANANIPVGKSDVWLLSLPLYHVSGLSILLRMFTAGGSVMLNNRQPLGQVLRNYPVTHVSLVAAQLFRLLKDRTSPLKKLKCILVGGSAIPPGLIQECRDRFLPVYLTYGLTETASQVATTRRYDPKKRMPGVRALNSVQLKTGPGGEILVKGPMVCLGYWDGKNVRPAAGAGGWLRTGDLGKMTNEELAVFGRRDNMFISGGENIYPEEIERRLTAIRGVEQAVVIPVKNKEFGQRPAAFIQMTKAVSSGQIKKELTKHLPKFKIPDTFLAWPSLDVKGIKLQRRDFAELLQKKKVRSLD